MEEDFNPEYIRRKLLPKNASDVYRNRLRYLAVADLSGFNPAIHTDEIKDMFKKFSRKWEIELDNLDGVIDSSDVFGVTAMLKVLREVQKDLRKKDLRLGGVFYVEDKKCFKYFNFKSYVGEQK